MAHVTPDGCISFKAKSIAFHNMTEDGFAELYSDTINAIIKHILPRDITSENENEYREAFQRILDYD